MNNVFKKYADYYNLLYHDKDYRAEVNYIDSLIKAHEENRSSSILDLGCGTGIHANMFAEIGYTVHGKDISPEMIEIAKKTFNRKELQFEIGDVRSFKTINKYDVVVSLFHVMSYQISNVDLINVFSCIKQSMKSDGVFIFDSWYGPAVLNIKPGPTRKNLEDDKLKITRIASPLHDQIHNTVQVNYKIDVTDKSNSKKFSFEESHMMRYLFFQELQILLNQIDMEIINTFEWMTFDKPSLDSWASTFVVKNK
jgi:2-polyprenyl-3-methyl-5-hydroxy-6-metoxy-1,4-benzoquinol methylase